MSRDERERLRDIVEALEAIREHVGGSLEEPTINGPVVLDTILFRLIVIGEAVKNVSAEPLETAADMRWSDVAGLRDVIAHESPRPTRIASQLGITYVPASARTSS